MKNLNRVSVYFVATPLHYLAAKSVADNFEADSKRVLVWYNRRSVPRMVKPEDWDASGYMPWPRFDPLPGPFGSFRRLRENIRLVADLVGKCEELHIHSPVFDTEAINYFLRALPKACGAKAMRARILPDGVLNAQRHPLSPAKVAAQYLRKLRRLAAPELDYWCFTGDRIGSDASFCDRIYVMPNMLHQYSHDKVVTLPPLVKKLDEAVEMPERALIVGQPLVGVGLMSASDRDKISEDIRVWLAENGITQVDYKGHPRDPRLEMSQERDNILDIDEPLESYMGRTPYSAIVGVCSTALLFARQIYPENTRVVAFGFDKIRFKTEEQEKSLTRLFSQNGIEFK